MKKIEDRKGKLGEIVGFRPDDDVRELLEVAMDATGSSATDLVQDCVRAELVAVVDSIQKKREEAGGRFKRLTAVKEVSEEKMPNLGAALEEKRKEEQNRKGPSKR